MKLEPVFDGPAGPGSTRLMRPTPPRRDLQDRLVLWVARGFGAGLSPRAPGTVGSVVGLLWFLLLAASGSWGLFFAGLFAGIILSIWVAGRAEAILNRPDPGEVVIDEVVAIPVCLLPWLLMHPQAIHPSGGGFLAVAQAVGWLPIAAAFATFRFFDILKPWPVNRSQRLPGGWGITCDDILAAVYAGIIVAWVVP